MFIITHSLTQSIKHIAQIKKGDINPSRRYVLISTVIPSTSEEEAERGEGWRERNTSTLARGNDTADILEKQHSDNAFALKRTMYI